MAALLGESEWDFVQKFTRLRPQRDGLALLDKENGECIFWTVATAGCRRRNPFSAASFRTGGIFRAGAVFVRQCRVWLMCK